MSNIMGDFNEYIVKVKPFVKVQFIQATTHSYFLMEVSMKWNGIDAIRTGTIPFDVSAGGFSDSNEYSRVLNELTIECRLALAENIRRMHDKITALVMRNIDEKERHSEQEAK